MPEAPVRLALCGLLLTATCAWAQGDGLERSAEAQRQAWEHHQAHRYEQASRGYREALSAWPENARALNNLAWLLLTATDTSWCDPGEALRLAERAVALEPDEPNYLDTLATARDALGDHLAAARLQLRAAQLVPAQADFGARLRDFARRGLQAETSSSARAELRALAVWGELQAGARDAQRLLAELDQADAEAEQGTLALRLRARLLSQLGRDDELLQVLEAELATGAPASASRRLRGETLLRLGRHAAGAADLEASVALEPADYELRLAAARGWRQAGSPAGVARVVSAAVAALGAQHPLWEGKWAQRLHTLAAETHEATVAEVQSGQPSLARAYRREAVAHRVRAAAARTESDKPAPGLRRALRALGHPAADLPLPERRWVLAEELLGQRGLPRFEDASDRLASRRGRRLAFADVDGDGDPDLLLDGGTLLLNDGHGGFASAPAACGLRGRGRGGVFADVDRDGDLDLFRTGGGADALYLNESSGGEVRFRDATAELADGLDDGLPSEGAGWGDVNGDGFPDLYVANYELDAQHIDTGTPDRLWLSDGLGRLRAAHDAIALPRALCGRGVSPCDFDQDGDVDVFVSNYRLQPDLLFVNDGGRLEDQAQARGVAGVRQRGSYGHTIGAVWGDLDGDGDLDLVCANLAHPRFIDVSDKTMVYLQQPDGRFEDARERLGIWFEETHSQPTLWDMDDDGDLDLSFTAVYGGRPSSTYRNRLVEDGRPGFEEVSWGTSTRVFNGWGAAVADVDGDGDLDQAVSEGGTVRLLLNQGTPTPRGSVRVRLRGTRSDTWGAYATCTLRDETGRRLVRQLTLGEGTTCQSEPILHFGVGDAVGPFTLTVRWPAGAVSTHTLGRGRHEVVEPWVRWGR